MPKKKTEIAVEPASTPPVETPPVETDMEDYDAAFDEAVTAPEGDDVVVASSVADDQLVEPSEGAVTPPVAETPPLAATPPTPAPADTQALESRIVELETSLAAAAKQPTEMPAPSTPPVAAPVAPVALSEEDQEVITEVEEDWPTINRAQEIRIAQLETRLMAAVTAAVGGVKTEMQPFVTATAKTTQDTFRDTIVGAHADAEALLPEVEKWIATEPGYLQSAMNHVLDRGTAAEVIALYTQYKTAKGITVAETPAPNAADDARLANMEGVRTERTSVAVEDDPSDFDGAFDRAASLN